MRENTPGMSTTCQELENKEKIAKEID